MGCCPSGFGRIYVHSHYSSAYGFPISEKIIYRFQLYPIGITFIIRFIGYCVDDHIISVLIT